MLEILLEAALRATLIAGAALIVLWSLRVRTAAARHRVWAVVMLSMLVLPLVIAWTPNLSLRVLPPAPLEWTIAASPPADVEPIAVAPLEPAPSGVPQLGPAEPSQSWKTWMIAAYLVGVAVLLGRLAIGTARVRLLDRNATVVNGFLTSARIATPFTFGLLKPKVVLPSGWDRWSPGQLALVLDHERAHVARRDPLVQWLALLNRAVFWFHPLAWWLERHLAALAEEACDAAVLARGHSPADYSEQLLELARLSNRRLMQLSPGVPMPGSSLQSRLAKILGGDLERAGSRAASVGAFLLATTTAVALGTITLAQEAATPPPAQGVAPPVTQQGAVPSLAQVAAPPLAREVAASRTLLDIYKLALANDPVVREAEARYRAVAAASPRSSSGSAQSAAEFEATRQHLLLRVAEPYFGVVAAERTLANRQTAREMLARQLEQTERRFEVGLIQITELHEARASHDEAVADELTAQRALGEAQQRLREIVGEPAGRLRPPGDSLFVDPPSPADAEEWIETALEQNPELVATRLRAESDGDVASREPAGDDLERVERRIEQETRAAYLGVLSEFSRATALEQAVESNQEALQATRAAFEAGTRSTADLLRAQNNLRQVETAQALSRYDYALSVLRLRGAAGSLTEEELDATRSWFE